MSEETSKFHRKVIYGTVVSDKMDKTIVIEAARLTKHPKYGKYYKVFKKFKVHDEKEEGNVGDLVEVIETRPLSKQKRFRLNRIVEKAKSTDAIEVGV